MTMMTGFDMHELDVLDEEYLGPPPRFLVENRPSDFDFDDEFAGSAHDASPLGKLKLFLGIGSA